MECKKSIDGKHLFERSVITFNELSLADDGHIVDRIPVYAEYCVKCGMWGKVENPLTREIQKPSK